MTLNFNYLKLILNNFHVNYLNFNDSPVNSLFYLTINYYFNANFNFIYLNNLEHISKNHLTHYLTNYSPNFTINFINYSHYHYFLHCYLNNQ